MPLAPPSPGSPKPETPKTDTPIVRRVGQSAQNLLPQALVSHLTAVAAHTVPVEGAPIGGAAYGYCLSTREFYDGMRDVLGGVGQGVSDVRAWALEGTCCIVCVCVKPNLLHSLRAASRVYLVWYTTCRHWYIGPACWVSLSPQAAPGRGGL